MSRAARVRRSRRSLPAGLVALAGVAGCALVAVACVQQATGRPPLLPWHRLADLARQLHWRDTPVLVAAGAAAGLGLVLLLCAVLPGRPVLLPLGSLRQPPGPERADPAGDGIGAAVVAGRGVRAVLRQVAADTDGVTGARVRLGARTVRVTVRTPRADPAEVRDRVSRALSDQLDRAALARRPHLRVTVRAAASRSATGAAGTGGEATDTETRTGGIR